MPELGKVNSTRYNLPSTENELDQAWVELKDELLFGDIAEIAGVSNPTEQAKIGIKNFITAWNLTIDGQIAPITLDNISKMKSVDIIFLSEKISALTGSAKEGMTDDEKKDSSSTSTSNSPVVNQIPVLSPTDTPPTS